MITSLELSGIPGLELCWAARSHAISERQPIFIIAMSSDHSDRRLAEVLDSGADEFIQKAPNETALAARLRLAARVHAREHELITMALRDPLTDLYNRRGFFDKAAALCQRARADRPLGVAIFDIDHFKSVNDRYGHGVGDKVIRRVARHAQGLPGIVGRIGGEEFAVLLPDAGESQVLELCEQLRRSVLSDTIAFDGGDLSVTISIGIASEPGPSTPDDILRRADVALYRAKSGGRNRTVLLAAGEDPVMPLAWAHARSSGKPAAA
jgi:diguanylate cyclase (GGDEF)-like protein